MQNNSRLKNCFKLSSKIEFYVPATDKNNTEIDNTEYVNTVATSFSEFFGGATSTLARGYWVSDINGLVKESTTIIFAYCNEKQLDENLDKVIDLAEIIKKELKQDAIAININGEMYFI